MTGPTSTDDNTEPHRPAATTGQAVGGAAAVDATATTGEIVVDGAAVDTDGTALNMMRKAYEDAASAIDTMTDPQHAFEQATILREATDQLVGEAAHLRARMAARIWETEEMSLTELANRIGISKSRADQLLKTAKSTRSRREH